MRNLLAEFDVLRPDSAGAASAHAHSAALSPGPPPGRDKGGAAPPPPPPSAEAASVGGRGKPRVPTHPPPPHSLGPSVFAAGWVKLPNGEMEQLWQAGPVALVGFREYIFSADSGGWVVCDATECRTNGRAPTHTPPTHKRARAKGARVQHCKPPVITHAHVQPHIRRRTGCLCRRHRVHLWLHRAARNGMAWGRYLF